MAIGTRSARLTAFTSTEVVYGVTGTEVTELPEYRRVAVMRGGHLAILRSGFGATKESEMAAGDIVPVPGAQFEETLASASPDLLRAMIREFAQRMMDATTSRSRATPGTGGCTPDRVNSRNGYRRREWDTRAGTWSSWRSRSATTGIAPYRFR